jgi:hypothetical protein
VNIDISFHQELKGIFVIKAAVDMQNNLPFFDMYVLFEIVFAVFNYYCFEGHRKD